MIQDKTRQYNTRHDAPIQETIRRHKARQHKTRRYKPSQDKTTHDNITANTSREDKTM